MPDATRSSKTAASELRLHEREQLVVPRLHNLRQRLPGELFCGFVTHAGNLDGFVRPRQLSQGAGVFDLYFLGVLSGGSQRHGDVVCHLITRDRDHGRVPNCTIGEHCDVGRATADVHHAHAQLTLIVREHRMTRRNLLEDNVPHTQTTAFDALLDVLGGVHGAGNQMHLGFEAHS